MFWLLSSHCSRNVCRVLSLLSSHCSRTICSVQIRYHREEFQGLVSVAYQKLYDVKAHNPGVNFDISWKASTFGSPRPSWSGMMQRSHQGVHHGKSSVMFLLMIDMCKWCYMHLLNVGVHQFTCMSIECDTNYNIWDYSDFYTQMSFLGCIGHLMAASGLQQVLELIYTSNAVVHILFGQVIARAVQAHLIVDAALNALVMSNTFN